MKYDIRKIYAQMEIDLIASMKRNLKRHEAEEKKLGFKWPQWQQLKLQDLKQYQKEAQQIVRKAEPAVEAAIQQEIPGGFRSGIAKVTGVLKKLWNKLTPSIREKVDVNAASDESFFALNQNRVQTLVDASRGELKAARVAILRQGNDVFRQTIFKSQVYLNSGAGSLGQAIDMATRDFLDKGFDYITYSNGRRVNVASYAEMALRTSSQRAVFAGEGAKRQQIGIRTVVVSAHNNCSELCLPWQGKVYVDDVYSGGKASDGPYPLLSTAMAGGLFHPHCRHNMTTFVPGASRLPEPVDDAEAQANYKAEQKQRYMERQIRQYKRREAGSVDPVNQAAAAAKVKEWQGKLRNHMKANEQLRRDYSREKNVLPPESLSETMRRHSANDTRQYERYKLIYGDSLSAKSLEDFQRIKYTDSERWRQLKADRQKTLNTLDYHSGMFGKFGDVEIREWYIAHDKAIVHKLDNSMPIKDQAKQAHSLRNKYRFEARQMMSNREEAERLDRENPHSSFEELVQSKMTRKKMTEEQAYQDIINTAGKTNKDVNKRLGLE